MNKNARILYIYDSKNESARTYVTTLREALPDLNITTTGSSLTTLLFEIRKCDLAHLFLPADARTGQLLKSIGGKTRLVQTVTAPPAKPWEYESTFFGDRMIVFSEVDRAEVGKHAPRVNVECIPPCAVRPDTTKLIPSLKIREKYQAGDRLLVVSLTEIASQQQFDSFLYIMREYNRRGGFRFLIPKYATDRETRIWRERAQQTVSTEKLECVSLLSDGRDIHSLIDAADLVLHLRRTRDADFDCSLLALESLQLGKPLFCFDLPPLNETLRRYRKLWICGSNEDFVRESMNLQKQMHELEQISTDIARLARERHGVPKIASAHRRLYEALLTVNA